MHNLRLLLLFLLSFNFLSAQGTYSVLENIPANQLDEEVELLGALGDRLLYFDIINDERKLWVSDATTTGTFQIGVAEQEDISLIAMTEDVWYFKEEIAGVYHISELTVGSDNLVSIHITEEAIEKSLLWNGSIYYTTDSPTSFSGDDLVKFTPGTSTNEVLFTSDFGGVKGIGSTDTEVMFIASMDTGKMLGKTDGTLANTVTFHMLYPSGSEFGNSVFMESDGDKLYFAYHPSNNPYNLWVTDGTSAGTSILSDYDAPSFGAPDRPFAFLDGKFYFILREADAPSGTTFELHVSDGTVNGTFNLNPFTSGYLHPRQLTVFNDKIYFNSLRNNWGLMSTDGTVSGTETIVQPYGHQSGGIGGAYENGLYEGSLVIRAFSEDLGSELYISDGTLSGTTLLSDVVPGTESSSPSQFIQVGDLLFFVASINGPFLWVYDPNFIQETNVLDRSLVSSFQMFPNPVSREKLNLKMSFENTIKSITIDIIDITGKVIFHQKNIDIFESKIDHEISVQDFSNGEYLILISSENYNLVTDKFIVEKSN